MPDRLTPAERQQRRRDRQRGIVPPLAPCTACGRQIRGPHAPLCSRCWQRLTDTGREWNRQRTAASRARRQAESGPDDRA